MEEREKLIQQLIKEKGGTRAQYLHLLNSVANHETGGTFNPAQSQSGDGPGRGKYQFEVGKHKGGITAANRLKEYYKRNNNPIPNWLRKATKGNDLDVSNLTSEQQDALFLGNMREHPKADFSKVWNEEQSVSDFWANNHWAGKKRDRRERVTKFNKDYEAYSKDNPYPVLTGPKDEGIKDERRFQDAEPLVNPIVQPQQQLALGGNLDGDPPIEKSNTLKVKDASDPRYIAYKDSLDLYNNYIDLTKSLKEQGYPKWKSDSLNVSKIKTPLPDSWFGNSRSAVSLRDPKSMNKTWEKEKYEASNKEGLARRVSPTLMETPDFITGVVNRTLPNQLYSDTIDPTSLDRYVYPLDEEFQNTLLEKLFGSGLKDEEAVQEYNKRTGDYRPGDARLVANYSNVNPKQEVTVEESEPMQLRATKSKNKVKKIPINPSDVNLQNSKEEGIIKSKPSKVKTTMPFNISDYLGKGETWIDNKNRRVGATELKREENEYRREQYQENLEKKRQARESRKLAYGGGISGFKQHFNNKELNQFNTGGSHEANPLGGIPQGIGSNGKPNTVEQGETSFKLNSGKYIFSDRIKI